MSTTSKQVKEYRKTFKGRLTLIYSNQKATSKTRGMPLPNYTKEQLKDWLLTQPNFQSIWDNWVNSNYSSDLSPSIDRLDNKLPYTFGNIQLTTWKQNLLNQKRQHKTEEHLHSMSKGVIQMDMDGNILGVFGSIHNAIRSLGKRSGISNISRVCDGELKQAYGFLWKWA